MTYKAFRARVHERVCIPARSCTCPTEYGREVITNAREQARHVHVKFDHPGSVECCESPHDVICKAVFS